VALFGVTLATFGLVAGFRVFYFGQVLPQPVSAKGGLPSAQDIGNGLQYLAGTIEAPGVNGIFPFLLPLTCLAAMFVWTTTKTISLSTRAVDIRHVVITMVVLAHLAFILCVGGDWMTGGRFLVPILPLLAVMAAFAAGDAAGFVPRPLIVSVICIQLGGFPALAFAPQARSLPLWQSGVVFPGVDMSRFDWFERTNWSNLRHLRSVPYFDEIVRRARQAASGKLHVWVAQAGVVPYYLSTIHYGAIEFTDIGGLTDRRFISCEYLRARVTRGAFGFSLPELAAIPREMIERECQVRPPDILYALGEPRHFRRWESDMVVVYRQHERNIAGSTRVWSPSFISVRSDVFLAIGAPPLVDANFDDVTLGSLLSDSPR
jgi:hypothetical protein